MQRSSSSMRLSAALLCSALLHGLLIAAYVKQRNLQPHPEELDYPVRLLTITLTTPHRARNSENIQTTQQQERADLQAKNKGEGTSYAAPPARSTPPTDTYLKVSELDFPPQIVEAPDLDRMNFGPLAEGTAMLRLWVSAMGKVDRLEIENSSLPAAAEHYLISNRELYRLEPGRKNLGPVKSTIRFQVVLSKEPTAPPPVAPKK